MIIDKQDRTKLSEGRNFGMGFSILEKIDNNIYETIIPFTACKDYLNDVVYVERTNKELKSIHGLKHEYTGVFENTDYFYLGVKALHYKSGTEWDKYDELENILISNYNNIVRLLNKLEEKFNIEDRTEIEDVSEGTVIFKVPMFWGKFNFLISLYSLYIRCFPDITEDSLDKTLEEFINNYSGKFIIINDSFLFNSTKHWIDDKYFNRLLDYEYPDKIDTYMIHNGGISSRLINIKSQLNAETVTTA